MVAGYEELNFPADVVSLGLYARNQMLGNRKNVRQPLFDLTEVAAIKTFPGIRGMSLFGRSPKYMQHGGNGNFCGIYDIPREPGYGRYAAHSGRLADRNITNQ